MKRIIPKKIKDKVLLSILLERYLATLENSSLQVRLKALAYDSSIPESIFVRLAEMHKNMEDAPNITVEDFHILFANILFRYPTVKIWQDTDGSFFFEL